MIKYILFDLGGILVPEAGKIIDAGIAEFLGISSSEFAAQFNKYRADATKGKIDLLQLYSNIVQNLSLDVHPKEVVKKHLELYKKTSTARSKEILNLISKIRNKYLIACLTNTEIEIAEYNQKSGLFSFFDKVFTSTNMGMMKPDKEIFNAVIKELGCEADEILFIDDKIDYARAAENTGMQVIHFENPNQLSIDLKTMKILD